ARGRRDPGRLRSTRRRDRVLDVAAGALREVTEDQVAVNRRTDGRLRLRLALEPVDEVAVMPAELALRLLEAGLEGRMELVVVVAERGVGDLESRSGFGGHSTGEPRVGGQSCSCRQSSAATTSASDSATRSGPGRRAR